MANVSPAKSRKDLGAWKNLESLATQVKPIPLRKLLSEPENRSELFSITWEGLLLDFSKQKITKEIFQTLMQLADEVSLEHAIREMFDGERINITEQRPALHVALRSSKSDVFLVDGENVVPKVHAVLGAMEQFADSVRSGGLRGATGNRIKNVVNIGIGGSDLGPAMAYQALRFEASREINVRFLSNVDGVDFRQVVENLDARETLFIVSSKTFTTAETMANARAAKAWIQESLGDTAQTSRHFVAVSTNLQATSEFGIDPSNVFEFWDWVGGRFSLDSAIGLSLMIAIGSEKFHELLSGFREMDLHFRHAPFEQNLPVVLALMTIWNTNFLDAASIAILPYSQYLSRFPAFLQQLEMESNGKSVTTAGYDVNYPTSPVYWGEPGTNGQHSFFQLLHQGTQKIPCEFIAYIKPLDADPMQHQMLLANMLAQSKALAIGKSEDEVRAEGAGENLVRHRTFPGDRPSSTILFDNWSAFELGRLVALYEHAVFVQGVLWNVDSFDQWGVELGKVLAAKMQTLIQDESLPMDQEDASTQHLVNRIRKVSRDD